MTLPKEHFLDSGLAFAAHERMTKVRKLQTNQLFESWPLTSLLLISYHCFRKSFAQGEVIIDGDKENKHAYAVVEGSCVLQVDGATQMVSDGFSVGADTVFDDAKQKDPWELKEKTIEEEEDSMMPERYHVVADSHCVVYMVGHELLRTLVPTAAREVLEGVGKFRLAVLAQRAERRRMLAAQENAKHAEEIQKQAMLDAGAERTREAWIAAQKRAVELRTPSSSHGASMHMLLNTEAAMREMQRAERRSHSVQLSAAVQAAAVAQVTALGRGGSSAAGGRAEGVAAAVQAVDVAVSTVQKLQSVVASLKSELIEYRLLLRNAGRYEVQRLNSAIERLVSLVVSLLQHDATVSMTTRRNLTWRRDGKAVVDDETKGIKDVQKMLKKDQGKTSAGRSRQDEARRRRKWVPLFKALPAESPFFGALAAKLEERTVRRKEVVVEKGALANEMYFIVAGEAEVLASLDEPPFVTLKEGTFFGETALLVEAPRNAYVRASKTMEMYVLSKTNLHAVFLEFPHVEQIMQHFADGEARRKELLAAEEEARTHNVTGRPVHQHKKARKKVHLAPARSVEELVRQLNLCSRLCSRASAVLALCVAWHVNGEPEAQKDGEVAQEIANNFAKHSGEIKTASLLPAEMLHQVLQRCELHVAGVN